MTKIRWFKLDPHTFDRPEFRYLAKIDEYGESYQLAWVKMLCEAVKRCDGGRIYLRRESYIKPKELAMLTEMKENVIEAAIYRFEELGLISYDNVNGLVITNFSDYVGEEYCTELYARENKYKSEPAEQKNTLAEAELKKERNREAQRRWRERQREQKLKGADADDFRGRASGNKDVTECNSDRNASADSDNKNVIHRNSERNTHKHYTAITPPKNIFIEENREEESRIEDKRTDETKKENKNNIPLALPTEARDAAREEKNAVYFLGDNEGFEREPSYADEALDKEPSPQVADMSERVISDINDEPCGIPSYSPGAVCKGNENSSCSPGAVCISDSESEVPRGTVCDSYADSDRAPGAVCKAGHKESPAHSGGYQKEEKLSYSPGAVCNTGAGETEKKPYGIFRNVYLSEEELSQLRERFGELLDGLIEDLSAGMESEGRSYKNHFATLIRWGKNEYAAKRANATDSVRASGKSGGGGENYPESSSARDNSTAEKLRQARASAPCEGSESSGAEHGSSDLSQAHGYNKSMSGTQSRGGSCGRAQKKDSRSRAPESLRTLTPAEADEAFRLALERSMKAMVVPDE